MMNKKFLQRNIFNAAIQLSKYSLAILCACSLTLHANNPGGSDITLPAILELTGIDLVKAIESVPEQKRTVAMADCLHELTTRHVVKLELANLVLKQLEQNIPASIPEPPIMHYHGAGFTCDNQDTSTVLYCMAPIDTATSLCPSTRIDPTDLSMLEWLQHNLK